MRDRAAITAQLLDLVARQPGLPLADLSALMHPVCSSEYVRELLAELVRRRTLRTRKGTLLRPYAGGRREMLVPCRRYWVAMPRRRA